jgi:hypothetical protein
LLQQGDILRVQQVVSCSLLDFRTGVAIELLGGFVARYHGEAVPVEHPEGMPMGLKERPE